MEKQVAGAETTINAPIETVWHAITRSKIALMPGTTVESDWEIGNPITFEGEFNGKPFKDFGEIIEKTEGSSVAFRIGVVRPNARPTTTSFATAWRARVMRRR